MSFVRATKEQARLRLALVGPPGSGKTFTALAVAQALVSASRRVAVIDTERGSASKYADLFSFDTDASFEDFSPRTYVRKLREAEDAGYSVIVIDSLSHAWVGRGGALDQVDREKSRGNSFTAWKDVTPQQNALVDAILSSKAHVVCTMRTKVEYVLEMNEKGKSVPRKVGTAPVQREGLEYEFDVVGEMTTANDLIISKTRCPALSGAVFHQPGADLAKILREWLSTTDRSDGAIESETVAVPAYSPAPAMAPIGATAEEQIATLCTACDSLAELRRSAYPVLRRLLAEGGHRETLVGIYEKRKHEVSP
jgi:DNA polymerase III delta prime subunit